MLNKLMHLNGPAMTAQMCSSTSIAVTMMCAAYSNHCLVAKNLLSCQVDTVHVAVANPTVDGVMERAKARGKFLRTIV
jgi:hypothetical protein